MIKPEAWKRVKKGKGGCTIYPVEFTGASNFFKVKITPEELESLKDDHGVIWYYKVIEWALPQFEGESEEFCEWLSARLQNYM